MPQKGQFFHGRDVTIDTSVSGRHPEPCDHRRERINAIELPVVMNARPECPRCCLVPIFSPAAFPVPELRTTSAYGCQAAGV